MRAEPARNRPFYEHMGFVAGSVVDTAFSTGATEPDDQPADATAHGRCSVEKLVSESVLPSGSLNQATRSPPGVVQMPFSS